MMASSIAKVVIGAKVKEMTKGLEGAIGLDEKKETSAVDAQAMKEAMEKNKQKREKEKKELHKYKEAERQDIRDKYQLRTASTPTPRKPLTRTETETNEEKKCSVS